MYRCRRCLNELAEQYSVRVKCVVGHIDIPSSCIANELLRLGTTIRLSDEFASIRILCDHIIQSAIVDSVNARCATPWAKRCLRYDHSWIGNLLLICLDSREAR